MQAAVDRVVTEVLDHGQPHAASHLLSLRIAVVFLVPSRERRFQRCEHAAYGLACFGLQRGDVLSYRLTKLGL